VHGERLVAHIRGLAQAGGGEIDADTFVGEPSFRAALHAAGGACEMTRALVADEAELGFCAVRPSGHHAEPDRAMGFCLFNNVALAAELAIRELGVERVFVLDWDVHHGNGTAEAFRRRRDVLFASIHQSGIYPGTGALSDVGSGEGEGYTINLPVPGGSEEELWLSLLEHIVLPAAQEFQPQLVLVSAGFDAHREDPLAGCRLEDGSFAEMARHVRDFAERADAPLGVVLEGGYEPAALARCVRETLSALAGSDPPNAAAPEARLTSRAAAQLSRYWEL
jgi:acetoin utilization deacetylase AcuC-like enzyme